MSVENLLCVFDQVKLEKLLVRNFLTANKRPEHRLKYDH